MENQDGPAQPVQVGRFAHTRQVLHRGYECLLSFIQRQRERETSAVSYLVYDVCWSLARSIAMFASVWLLSHEKGMDYWKNYLLLYINILFLDAVVKDFWYGSLKKGCRCRRRHASNPIYEGRSLVV